MKSPEQMGISSQQPKEEPVKIEEKGLNDKEQTKSEGDRRESERKRKITTPEEAAEMTRQRRKEFGLEKQEEEELSSGEIEALDQEIENILGILDSYDYESFSSEIQEQWYWAEQEARAGKDRALASTQLKVFLETLRKEAEKSEK